MSPSAERSETARRRRRPPLLTRLRLCRTGANASATDRSDSGRGDRCAWRSGRSSSCRSSRTTCVFPVELPHGFEVNDVEGEAAIPVDVLTADPRRLRRLRPRASTAAGSPGKADDEKAKELAAAAAARADAGVARDAGAVARRRAARAPVRCDAGATRAAAETVTDGGVERRGRRRRSVRRRARTRSSALRSRPTSTS